MILPTHKTETDKRYEDMLSALAPYAKDRVYQTDLHNPSLDYINKTTKVCLVSLSQGVPHFPPLYLAQLCALTKAAGFQTKVLDLGPAVYRDKNRASDFISDDAFYLAADEIAFYKPEVVYFLGQQDSFDAAGAFAEKLRHKGVDAVFVADATPDIKNKNFQYSIEGERENIFLSILDELEAGRRTESTQHLKQPEAQRLDINTFPLPDYSDLDLNEYLFPNALQLHISRGCTAKCAFCSDTHQQRYRYRVHRHLVAEIEHLCRVKNTYAFFFADNLVNGSLRELRAFCKEVIKKDLKIKWTGYCRFDTLMDRPFYEDLGLSGCVALVYGAESGSQRVLNLMNKGVSVEEMEQNLLDSQAVGMQAITNWMVGFPGEKLQDFADTLTFIWRNRNRNVARVNRRAFELQKESVVGQNLAGFSVSGLDFNGQWILKDFSFGFHHMQTRLRSFDIFHEMLLTEKQISHNSEHLKTEFQISFDHPEKQNELSYEDFDYRLIQAGLNPYADTLVNEIWPLLRTLWRARGAFKIKLALNYDDYKAHYDFKISEAGLWEADFTFNFRQNPEAFNMRTSRGADTIALQRAQRLAKATHTVTEDELQSQLTSVRRDHNMSFEYSWNGQGQWSASIIQ